MEVEVDVGGDRLDRRPEGLAEQRGGPEDPQLGEVAWIGRCRLAISGQQARSWSSSEAGVGRDVGQVEEGMADAGIFPVDQPEPMAVVDDVGRQQVVVAEDRPERRDPPR